MIDTPVDDLETSYVIDLFSDNVFDMNEEGTDASGTYPLGDHKVIWIVEDLCGNEIQIAQDFRIISCKI